MSFKKIYETKYDKNIKDNILEECEKESLSIIKEQNIFDNNPKKYLYQKLKEEIEDGSLIKLEISKKMSYNNSSVCYFSNILSTEHNLMHYAYDIIGCDSIMSGKNAIDLFEKNKYGEKPLMQILQEKFQYPIRIHKSYNIIKDEYSVCIVWPWKKINKNITDEKNECSIL